MIGKDLAYVALVVDDVEAAASIWQRDFGLPRTDCRVRSAEITAAVERSNESQDYREGIQAFLEKRAPRFTGT